MRATEKEPQRTRFGSLAGSLDLTSVLGGCFSRSALLSVLVEFRIFSVSGPASLGRDVRDPSDKLVRGECEAILDSNLPVLEIWGLYSL